MLPQSQYWLLVGSSENFEITRSLGFTLLGVKSTRRKMAEKIRPGDALIFYLTGKMLLGGIVTIQSKMVEDFSPVWACHSNPKKEERFPYRFQTQPYLIPDDSEGMLSVKSFHSQLNYLKKWPENNWTLGFQSTLHQWPEEDFRLVEAMFKETCAVNP